MPGKGWCRVWHPFVSAFTGYRAGRFPAWEQPPGNLHMSKLFLHTMSGTLGHLRLSWPALFPFAGSWLPCGLPSRNVAVSRESTTLILLRATGTSLALKTGVFRAILLRLLPASALALALAWLVPRFLLRAAWLARLSTATACLPIVSTHERRVIALSN